MDFALTDEQAALQRAARELTVQLIAPRAAARDATGAFPADELAELGRRGLLGVAVPSALGGRNAGALASALVIHELARGDAAVAQLAALTGLVGELLATRASPALAARWVPRLVRGELCGAFALSEADAGSDPSAIRTRGTRVDGGWRLTGGKQWVTAGDRAGCLIVWAATQPAVPGGPARGVTAFVVAGDAPGLTVVRCEDKLGLRGSPTAQLVLDGVTVGDDAVVGQVGGGFAHALVALDGGRIAIAAQATGIARSALALALAHTDDHAGLADAATWLDAAELMTWRAAERKQRRVAFSQQAAMAKLFASERAWQICDLALQAHGDRGYTTDVAVERALRDVRVTRIYEGTSEIQRLVIARELLLAQIR
jgi:alkylation response protein AidB-like acyl-CoA dehydrogenase